MYDAATDLQLAWGEFVPGRLAIVSQSGQVGSGLADLAAAYGLGVSRFVSVGNQADVTAREVLADLVDHDQTAVVAVYLESFGDGRALVETLRHLRAAGKPTLLLSVGASAAGRQAAVSHTGSLTSSTALIDAACRAAGAVLVETPAQLVAIARSLVAPLPPGRRVAVVGDSGGQCALAADVLTGLGLEVPALAPARRAELAMMLPPQAGWANPVDLAGAGEADLDAYADVVDSLLGDDAVDAVVLTGYFGSYGRLSHGQQDVETAVATRLALLARKHAKPVVVHSMSRESATLDVLRDQGVPVHHAIEDAARGVAALAHLAQHPGRATGLPADVVPLAGGGYLAARAALAECVGFPAAARIGGPADLPDAVRRLRAPYALKADWIAHKTEVGAVALGLRDLRAVEAAYAEMAGSLGEGTYVLEELDTRPHVVDMIVGARRDPVFGPTVLVGTGGVEAELFGDTALELGPVDLPTARRMIARLRGARLLAGWRGRPAVDVEALAVLVVSVSELLAAASPTCTDLELNPVRVGVDGVVAVDALVHTTVTTTPQEHA